MENSNLFIITGGPGSGKTTVLEELQKLGIPHVPEVARQIIQEQVRIGGEALPWKNRELYTAVMLERSIESYIAHTPAPRPILCDRGIPDTLGYAQLIALPDDSSIRDSCWKYRYASTVFLTPPWKEIYTTDSERKQDFVEAQRTSHVLARIYGECGYDVVEVPKLPPAQRAAFIVERLPRR